MSGTYQRTWQRYRTGHFLVTIQLDPVEPRRSIDSTPEFARVARDLIRLMETHRLQATWAVSDPTHSAATASILRSSIHHELAILGDAYWVGPTAGRTRFARELARRVLKARTSGINVTSFVPGVPSIQRHIDLIVKQHISAVACLPTIRRTTRQILTPKALHYGVWELPITSALPVRTGWIGTGGWTTWRQIRRAARDAATFHLLIDAPALALEGLRAERAVARLVQRVADWRDRGLVDVQTLNSAASRLAAVPAAIPQHSILRRAA